ncbi:MAG: twin-arginine translocation pathway signal protein [Alphaproteobacteria bacterium]|nr:twin-arginine translocation pathway signal protein [Alphaproteobacteria bacterium]
MPSTQQNGVAPAQPRACSRRAILKTGGAAALISFGAGCDIFRPGVDAARAPWDQAGESLGDPRLDALAYAILAPNPHNRQPWRIELRGESDIVIRADPDRLLPATDPLNRQIVVGFGCFLELLRQAAAEKGFIAEIVPFPDGEPQPLLDDRPIAHVRFAKAPDVERDPLFGLVLNRRTNRAPFLDRPVDADVLNRLDSALRPGDGDFEWANDPANVATVKDICLRGWRIESFAHKQHMESVNLTRIGRREVEATPDGIALYGRDIEAFRLVGFLTREEMAKIGSRAHQEMVAFYERAIQSAVAFGWISTESNTRKDQLNAGAGWVRLHLAATAAGISMHPLSQALQEFPEMSEPYADIHEFVGRGPGACVQGLYRFGYVDAPPPAAPRWPLQTRMTEA